MTKYFLGVDGGGTKTDALISDENLNVIGRASNGGANWERMGIAKALDSLETVIREAASSAGIKTSDISSASLAIAGIDWPDDVALYQPIATRLGIEKCEIMNDSFAALFAGSDCLEGIVSIAGTGGKTSGIHAGKSVQSMGMELGEGGGAGQLVGLALEYIAMQFHNTAAPSELYSVIPKILGFESEIAFFEAVARKGLRLDESLAPEIFKLADQNDVGALYAVEKTALQHAKDVVGMAKILEFIDDSFVVVRAGGLHTAGCAAFDNTFSAYVHAKLPNAKLVVLQEAPVMGALLNAAGKTHAK